MNNKKKALAVFSVVLVLGIAVVNSEPDVTTLEAKQDDRAQKQTDSLASNSPKIQSKQEKLMEEAIANQLKQATEAYKFNAQFPPYSKPLYKENWDLLNPRAFIPRKQSISSNPDISGSLVLDKYIIAKEDPLEVKVKISTAEENLSSIQSIIANIEDSDISQSLIQTSFENGVATYSGQVSISDLGQERVNEGSITADIQLQNGDVKTLSARFKYHTTVARVQNVGDAYVDGSDLKIPVDINVTEQGKYRVQANLFDKNNDKPVAHLTDAYEADEGINSVNLKAHINALKVSGSAGPYYLSNITISKVSTHPGEKQEYGVALNEQFPIKGFDLSIYDEDNYRNPKYKDSIQFLERVSGAQ